MSDLLVLEGLRKQFGDFTAVDGISLQVGDGEVLGFLGPNGAGKSTTMKMAAGFLEPVADQVIDTLSKGFRRRVGLAQAILHEPKVLILDEPTDGLDPNQKHHVRELIKELSADRAIIISTHILEEVDAVCSRAIIIDKGRIVADGTADELRKQMPGRKKSSLDDVFRHFTSVEEAAA